MIIKLALFALLVGASVASPQRAVTFFGNALTNAVRYIGSKNVLKMGNLQENRVIFTFPKKPLKDDYVIKTIQQIDHAHRPAKVEFLEGGIGSKRVTLAVTARKGNEIISDFHFFGDEPNQTGNAERVLSSQFIVPDVPYEQHEEKLAAGASG